MNNTPVFDSFKSRHIGPRNNDINEMLKTVNAESIDKLIDETVPGSIRTDKPLNTGSGMSEYEFLNKLRDITTKNKLYKNYIGLGYFPSVLPAVIQRNILENPGWYTQYTPYQAEISQGRLEALLNYQTVIADMTGLHVSNASLLDEGTAAAEAMLMTKSLRKGTKANANVIFVSEECYPQTIEVVKTRAVPVGVKVVTGDHKTFELTDDVFAVLVQYPASEGQVYDYTEFFANAKSKGINTIVAADLMSLAMLKTPADMGADIAVGSTQRFGIPLGFGGPHAAYFATKEEYKRQIPGRIIGISIDVHNKRALRMALQTREQHIKREKATSNICTSQVLLAIMAGMYAVYHGPDGIKNIAARIHKYAAALNELITSANYEQLNTNFFDTLKIKADEKIIKDVWKKADALKINLRYGRDFIGISIDETTTANDIAVLASLFTGRDELDSVEKLFADEQLYGKYIPESMKRTTPFLTNRIFKRYHAEMEMMRYIKSLENKDLSLTGSMIPLGSCTMKLNAATEMLGITYPEIANIHPFAPADQSKGYADRKSVV